MSGLHFDITGDNSNIIRKLQETERGVKSVSSVIEKEGTNIDDLFGRMTRAAATFAAGISVKEIGQNIIKIRGEFQQLEVAFKTMLGSKEQSDRLMQQLVETAAKTPFDLQGVSNGAKQLLAYGLASDKVNETLVRLGDIAAGLSIPLNDIVYLYGTTMTQGRLFTQDLHQFMGRGIPLADELAKQFKVSKDEVGALVTAGKIGFEQVQKAIESMTNEGGKFGGLMDAQSRTITGQISNIEDSITNAFNKIGEKNESIINTGLSGVAYLVENYEEVGKAIFELIGIYGTYKAILITLSAVQKVHNALIAQTALNMNLAKITGEAMTIQQAKSAAITKLLTFQIKSLNAALLANPYALVTAALVSLGYALYKVVTNESELEKATGRLAEANSKVEKNVTSESSRLADLERRLIQAKKGTQEYEDIKQEIVKKYGQYYDGLDGEIERVGNLSTAYEMLVSNMRKGIGQRNFNIFLESEQAFVDEKIGEKLELAYKKLIEKFGNGKGKELYNSLFNYAIRDVGMDIYTWKELSKVSFTEFGFENSPVGIAVRNVQQLALDIKKIQGASNKAINDYKSMYDVTGESGKDTTNASANTDENYAKVFDEKKKAWEKAKKKLDEIEKDKDKFTKKAYIDAKKALDDAEKEYKLLGGITGSALAKQENKAKEEIKEQEKINEQILSLRRQNQQDKINIMKDGKEKELAQINLNYQKELDVIRRNEKKVAESQDGKLTSKQVVMFSQMRGIAKSKKQHNIDEVNEGEVEKYKKLLEKYQDYITKYSATKKKFDDDKKKMQEQGASEEQLNEVDYQRDLALESISEEFAMREDSFKSWMDSIANMSIEKLKEQLALAKTELENAERENPNDKGLAIQRAKVDKLEKTISSNKIKRSTKDWQDLYRTLGKVDKELGEIGDSIGGVAGEAIKTAGSITTASLGMISGILEVSQSSAWAIDSTATTATNAIKMVENASVIIAVISAALKIAMKIAELFSGKSSYEKYQEATEVYDAYIDTLDKVIDRRLKLAESLTGKDADVAYKEALELYKEQEEAARILGKQYLESRKKRNHSYGYKEVKNMSAAGWEQAANAMGVTIDKFKNMMGDRMTGLFDLSASELINLQEHARVFWAQLDDETRKYLDQIIEGVDATSEVVQQSLENFTGTSFDSFSDGILEQLYEVGTKSEDIFNDMSDNIRKSLIKAMYVKNIEPELKKWYDLWGNSIKDDGEIDETEREKLEEIKKNLVDSAISQVEEINKIWRDENSIEKQEASRGFGTEMTHEDAGELSGRFAAMQVNAEETKNAMLNMVVTAQALSLAVKENGTTLSEMLNIMISSNSHLEDISEYTKRILIEFNEKLSSINENINKAI